MKIGNDRSSRNSGPDRALPAGAQTSPEIVDLIAVLSATAERLGVRLRPQTATSLADLVRQR